MGYSPYALIAPRFFRPTDDAVATPNERTILRVIWRNPGVSRTELTGLTDLAQQTIHRLLDQLAERKIISLGSPKPGLGKGQPSPMLTLDGSYAWSCGMSVNTDVIDVCLMDFAGSVLAETNVQLREKTVAQALERVRDWVKEQQGKLGLSDERFFGVGLGIAGFHVSGTSFNASLPLHEWSLIELGPLLTSYFDRPVWALNGGKTGTIAEAMFGVGRHIKNFAYLSFNYGFGGGLISDGELLHGGNGNAGEFSQMYEDEEITRRPALQIILEKLKAHGVDVPSITYLRRNFDPRWPGVVEWLDEITPAYNRLINAIWAVYDPQAIVFGGQIPTGLADMMIARTRLYGKPRYGVGRASPKLIVSEIKPDAAAMGAAATPFKLTFF
ncbi:putative NBD/HSP70 family sugar kinase [Agrobacterium tumefaciens]|uniref:ROK family transcriptional regulator n=1 Tax=Agrobacterium tumefaciens TaxID=358 RepID=UPI000DCFABA4|nr:ROK family transcriptional regulator [Agrobacterium tumefaciens]MBP2509147.1 putative NBD/HSP70 family sugar kinase [Agrobacterium tumefaciens]MBP2518300.1 putative NBD/HSP70 family sugar kinase [Agrobacterium tumefaciens]MBP2576933.1 putative NBD/HSP70 family sugar kinase [Agrobacterium tumefaciens]MBP2594886.1 putative NBD/HSP70 family sugar kinase [Agrobacterium tumefaciens]